MRLFEREANTIREAAYSSFLEYRRIWDYIESLNSNEDLDSPEAQRAYYRAFQQRTLADFLDRKGSYNFWTRYRSEGGKQ